MNKKETVSNQMIRSGYKQNRVYWNRGGEIKYIVADLTDLTLMSALITEFFQYEFHKAREN